MPIVALCSLYVPKIIKILQVHSVVTSKNDRWPRLIWPALYNAYAAVMHHLPWRTGCSRSRNQSVWRRDRALRMTDDWHRRPGRYEWRLRPSSRRCYIAATPARRQTTARWPSTPRPRLPPESPRGPIAHLPLSALCPVFQLVKQSIKWYLSWRLAIRASGQCTKTISKLHRVPKVFGRK